MSSSLKYVRNVGWKDRLFGLKCPHCDKRGGLQRDTYTRGWNEMCTQASGDVGFYCMRCQHITFLTSYEEARRTTPTWCTVSPDTDRRKWFPDFKHNHDTSRIPEHSSHRYAAEAK